jgi:uncharacterized protein
VKSPCINICQMDPQRGLCIGCRRTLDEITRWAAMSDAERERTLQEIKTRTEAGQTVKSP